MYEVFSHDTVHNLSIIDAIYMSSTLLFYVNQLNIIIKFILKVDFLNIIQ